VLVGLIVLGSFFWLPTNIHYHVTERYIFWGGGEETLVYLGGMLPHSRPSQQVKNVEISWDGNQQRIDKGFVEIYKLSTEKQGSEQIEALIEYDVILPQGSVFWQAPVEDFQRLPQIGIESDSDCIQNKSAQLTNGVSEKDAYKIYSFTADYLTYSREDIDCTSVSAVKAFEIGSCVCAGYARLMTALCRASGIPSQMVIGLVYPDPIFQSHATAFPQNPDEVHAWVEYYSDGLWKMADPTWGAIRIKALQFNRNDGRHLVYGELEQVLSEDRMLETWALYQADHTLSSDKCIRFVASSTSDQVRFLPVTSVKRTWDGRWLNTLIAWGMATLFLCKYRYKIIAAPHSKPNSYTSCNELSRRKQIRMPGIKTPGNRYRKFFYVFRKKDPWDSEQPVSSVSKN
jgi:hypothetical protein